MSKDRAWVRDIVIAGRKALAFASGRSFEDFQADGQMRSAILYQLTVIGEAARRISEDFRAEHPEKQAGVVTPQIKDWRWLVDSVAVDPAYDGRVFNARVSDIPERKTDMVNGTYEFDAPARTVVAVRLTDMLGEDVFVTKNAWRMPRLSY